MEEEILETQVPENNQETDVETGNDEHTEDITDSVDSENNENNNENTDTSDENSDVITDPEQDNTDGVETPVEDTPDDTTGTDEHEDNNEEISDESSVDEPQDPSVSVQEPKNVKVAYTSLAWVNKDMQILHAVDLTVDGENYGSQLIPIASCIGQTIVRYMTDNGIIVPIEAENLEDETELSDERLFVIVQENIQAYMDTFAHTRDYDNAIYCISYINSIVPRFKNEAKRMMVYRDLCWAIANDLNAKYRSGERDRPTLEEIMKALPELSWEGPIIGLDGEEIDLDAF